LHSEKNKNTLELARDSGRKKKNQSQIDVRRKENKNGMRKEMIRSFGGKKSKESSFSIMLLREKNVPEK